METEKHPKIIGKKKVKSPLVIEFHKQQKKKSKITPKTKKTPKPDISPTPVDNNNKKPFTLSTANLEILEVARATGVARCASFSSELVSLINRNLAFVEKHELESYVNVQKRLISAADTLNANINNQEMLEHMWLLLEAIDTCARDESQHNDALQELQNTFDIIQHNNRLLDVATVTSMRVALPIIKWFEAAAANASSYVVATAGTNAASYVINTSSTAEGNASRASDIDKETCNDINAEMLNDGLLIDVTSQPQAHRLPRVFTQECKENIKTLKSEVLRLKKLNEWTKTLHMSCQYILQELVALFDLSLEYTKKSVDKCDVYRTFLKDSLLNIKNITSVYENALSVAEKQHHQITYGP